MNNRHCIRDSSCRTLVGIPCITARPPQRVTEKLLHGPSIMVNSYCVTRHGRQVAQPPHLEGSNVFHSMFKLEAELIFCKSQALSSSNPPCLDIDPTWAFKKSTAGGLTTLDSAQWWSARRHITLWFIASASKLMTLTWSGDCQTMTRPLFLKRSLT